MTQLPPLFPALMPRRTGCIVATSGCVATVAGVTASVGDICVFSEPGSPPRRGEVLALDRDRLRVWLDEGVQGLSTTTRVRVEPHQRLLPVSDDLLGRVVNPFGRPIDGGPALRGAAQLPVERACPQPMTRRRVRQPFVTGVRVIDGLLALGIGQRVGVMAPAGVGKTTLLGMLARSCECDVSVIALVGERGREVREFVEDALGPRGLARSVVVCATSDRSPLERRRAALAATTIAEHFRDQGRHVLLMVDSLTRFARAQRELGLAQGELPTRRGYPPSLFAALPSLLERAGPGPEECGDITAVYTVLMEDAETADPVAEEAMSLLDGHFVLSRDVAAAGQYPAIDVRQSVSRLMDAVTDSRARSQARDVRALLAKHAEVQPLAQMGEYRTGRDDKADRAMRLIDPLREWMTQDASEKSDPYETSRRLGRLLL